MVASMSVIWETKRVQKFTSEGQYLTEWGKSGKLAGEFHYPSGIAVSEDSVFVADRDLNRIQKLPLMENLFLNGVVKESMKGNFIFQMELQ